MYILHLIDSTIDFYATKNLSCLEIISNVLKKASNKNSSLTQRCALIDLVINYDYSLIIKCLENAQFNLLNLTLIFLYWERYFSVIIFSF